MPENKNKKSTSCFASPFAKASGDRKAAKDTGFTLIELLVVVAIIALLSSIALIALVSARQKSRNAKRLSDMVQMLNGLELFNAQNRGYPDDLSPLDGIPDGVSPQFVGTIPKAPNPPDSPACEAINSTTGQIANTYYYIPSNCQLVSGLSVCRDFDYYFCLGHQTGNFSAGIRILTPQGVR